MSRETDGRPEEMLSEDTVSGGVRGKYAKLRRQGRAGVGLQIALAIVILVGLTLLIQGLAAAARGKVAADLYRSRLEALASSPWSPAESTGVAEEIDRLVRENVETRGALASGVGWGLLLVALGVVGLFLAQALRRAAPPHAVARSVARR